MTDEEFDRRIEVEALLEGDETFLGEVWRSERDGKSPDDIAAARGISTGPVRANQRLVRMVRDGSVPSGPTVAARGASKLRTWLKRDDLSPSLRASFEESLKDLENVADDQAAQTRESETAVKNSVEAEDEGVPGIYVYTLPHYLRHPVDEAGEKTLLKIGHSAKDAYFRSKSQGRLTALPEDPILLRIYPADQSRAAERDFHSWLNDAAHDRSTAKRGGSEWFVTSTRFLDRVALSMGLEVRVVNES